METAIRATGKSLDAFNRGKKAAASGLSEKDNPYLSYPAGKGGVALSGWWSAGFIAVKRL